MFGKMIKIIVPYSFTIFSRYKVMIIVDIIWTRYVANIIQELELNPNQVFKLVCFGIEKLYTRRSTGTVVVVDPSCKDTLPEYLKSCDYTTYKLKDLHSRLSSFWNVN